MSRFSRFSRFSRASVAVRLRRPFSKGKIVALLALLLGVVVGIRGPIAHAEPVACYDHVLYTSYDYALPDSSGDFFATFYASYRSNDRSYCGHTWARAFLYEAGDSGAPWGILYAYLYDCNNHLIAKNYIAVRGGGPDGQIYEVATSKPYLECGYARAIFVFGGHNHSTMTVAVTV